MYLGHFYRKLLRFALGTLLLGLVHGYTNAQLKLTLQQAIDSTLSRNLQIKEAQLHVQLLEEDYKQSKYNRLPNLTASPQASLNWGRTLDVSTYNYITNRVFLVSGTLGTQITLFQGGFLRKQILQNKLLLDADQGNLLKIKYDLTLATVTAFLQVLAAEDLLAAAKEQIALARLSVDKMQKSLNAGKKSTADLAQAQAQEANSEVDKATIQNQLNSSLITLKQLMYLPTIELKLERPKAYNTSKNILSDTASLFKMSLENNPDVKLANLRKDAAHQNIQVSKSYLYPTLSLFGFVGSNFSDARSLTTGIKQTGFDTVGVVSGINQPVLSPAFRSIVRNYPFIRQFGDNFYQYAGISLQIPIFNRFTAQTNIKKAKIAYQIAQLTAEISKNNFTNVISQAIADAQLSQNRLIAAEKIKNATQQLLLVSEKRFQVGLLNSIDYNTAVTNANKAAFNLIQAGYDLTFRIIIINFYRGLPILLD